MSDTRLSFTMRATVARGPVPPSRYGDGPLPPGCVRIPVTVQVALPPGATGLDEVPQGAALPVTMGPASVPAPAEQVVRRLGPVTGWPVVRGRGGGGPASVEARQRVLNSLFAGPRDAPTPK